MASYLDSLIFGIRDVFDKLGTKLPTRTALQFKGAVTVEDDPENKRTIVTVTGGGGGVTELDGDVTGPSDDTTVEAIQGVPVDSTPPEDGQVLAFVEADGKARWATPGGGGGPVMVGGDLSGTADDATVVGIQGTEVDATPPTDGQVLAYDSGDGRAKWAVPPAPDADGIPFDPTGTGLSATDVQGAIVELASGAVPASPYLAAVELALPTDDDPADELVYTVPACHAAIISRVLVVVSEPLAGAGSVTVRAGSTAGGDGYLIDKAITSASEGIIAGESIASLGTLFPAATGYEAVVSEGDEIHVRLTPAGEVAGGKVKVYVCGTVLT